MWNPWDLTFWQFISVISLFGGITYAAYLFMNEIHRIRVTLEAIANKLDRFDAR